MTITPISRNFELSPPQQSEDIDPREQMIVVLSQQNQALLESIDKAQAVFQENQAKQKAAIDNVSKLNDDLSEALLKSEARDKESQLMHNTENQALMNELKNLLKLSFETEMHQNLLSIYHTTTVELTDFVGKLIKRTQGIDPINIHDFFAVKGAKESSEQAKHTLNNIQKQITRILGILSITNNS